MLYDLLKPDIQELIQGRNFDALREGLANWEPAEVAELINGLPPADDVVGSLPEIQLPGLSALPAR